MTPTPEMKILNWLKENLSIIVLFPTVLGGLWQLLELAFIGIPYIRFFSVSQLIADGLLILLLLVVCMLFLQAIIFTKGSESESQIEPRATLQAQNEENESKDDLQKEREVSHLHDYGMLIISILIFAFFLWPHIKSINTKQKISFIDLLILIGSMSVFYETFKTGIKRAAQIPFFKKVTKIKATLFTIDVAFVILCFFVVSKLLVIFHNSFLFSDDLKNMSNIECKIKQSNSKVDTFNVVYFNDKYIFTQIRDSSYNTYMEVLKFDDLLDVTTCK